MKIGWQVDTCIYLYTSEMLSVLCYCMSFLATEAILKIFLLGCL